MTDATNKLEVLSIIEEALKFDSTPAMTDAQFEYYLRTYNIEIDECGETVLAKFSPRTDLPEGIVLGPYSTYEIDWNAKRIVGISER